MKVQHILADQHKLVDTIIYHQFQYLALHQHNIIVDGIVPLPDKFYNSITPVVISKQYF